MAGGDQRKKKKGKERLDKFYHLAKEQGYRARSAFKLLQLSQRFNLFQKNCSRVVDLCAAPGGWLQVAAKHCPVASTIVGVDLVPIQPIRGVETFTGDITTAACAAKLRKLVKFGEVDLVLHDGSPNMGTDWSVDAFNQNVLVLSAARLACQLLAAGATFVSKVFRSGDYAALLYVLQTLFDRVDATKPQASRAVSAEIFVVCRGFKKPAVLDERLFDPKYVFLQAEDETGEQPSKKALKDEEGGEAAEGESDEEEGIFFGTKGGKKGQFAELVRRRAKRHRNGDILAGLRRISVDEFFRSKDPTTLLVEQAREIFFQDGALPLEEAVRAHRLTTQEIRDCLTDVQVLGKAELAAILKWRFRVKKEISVALGLSKHSAEERKDGEHEKEAEGEEDGEEDADGSDGDSDAGIDEELSRLHASVSRREAKQQKRAAQKQKQLEMRKKLTRGAFFDAAEGPSDPDLFRFDAKAIEMLETKEEKLVDASLLLTGGEEDEEGTQKKGRRSRADGGEGEDVVAGSDESEDDGQLDDLDDVDRMEIELTLAHRLRKQREAEALAAGPKKKQTRREKVTGEWMQELQAFRNSMQRRAGEALAERRRAEEEENDDDDDEDNDEETSKEVFEDGLSESLGSDSRVGGNLRGATQADRWFSQPMFGGLQLRGDGEREASDDEFNPVIKAGRLQGTEGKKRQTGAEDSSSEDGQRTDEEDSSADVTRELADHDLPQVPLSEKQQQKRKRAAQAEKERNKKQRRKAAADGLMAPDSDEEDDKTGLRGKARIEEVPAPPEIQRPTDPDEVAEIQALGSLLVQKSARMDLIDGAYNRFAFNDDALPEWFEEDEKVHLRPELPVTKELMREYRQKLLDISRRPIRKVQEARARKKLREKRRLQKVKSQAAAVAESTEFTEAAKARAIDKIARQARRADGKRGKDYVVTRRVGGGKLAQKKAGKKGDGNNRVKLVDRRLKKDKRAMKAAMKKRGGKRGLKKKGRKA
ncbi:putative ftsJ-like methyltransferase domain-containing protein [Neospora caninum Liverpool]|uniref:Putative rRNA methyltransferase n=1 Tax=Neospora caninum (strain Liverpool) TaxID=572307 RepID=F0V7W3_NEOCL|nr:putative ftsJ-like methyltransferase domain-containing protein [Neospora caninum Liverpool]CBZ49804.1 putative ftsJ-like methyltransferase domain-containing protein [Neospora caninum Liverpool]CEL64392.1 TPA: ftsJ-like methyltransferase domain-containing protein, putative [Neospora caninum Liverpool]|eukprot:XP_003879839.1 putative ftsJ-like methyltransferase domain-containing protein [Neospora caninum Liverpool]